MLLEKLKEQKDFTNAERSIAEYILADPEPVTGMSLAKLKEAAFTSESAIVRLCHKVGCTGFASFKVTLAKELSAYADTLEIPVDTPFTRDDDPEEIMHILSSVNRRAVTDAERSTDPALIVRAARMIRDADTVCFFAQEQSLVIAEDMRYKLLRIGVNAREEVLQGYPTQMLKNMKQNDVGFVVSHYVSSYNILRWLSLLKKNHVPVILLTCKEDAPYLGREDLILTVHDEETTYNIGSFSGRSGMTYLCDCIVSVLFSLNYDTARKHLIEKVKQSNESEAEAASLLLDRQKERKNQ